MKLVGYLGWYVMRLSNVIWSVGVRLYAAGGLDPAELET